MINFTIIIPHKNTPELLQKCIDSVPKRDDIQIIVVDDNSDSSIVNFENFPGKDNPMVEIYFTKEGKGAGYARNVGLEHAQGVWIVFADADDYFHSCINDVFDQGANMVEDIVFFKAYSINLIDGSNGYRANGLNERINIALKTSNFQPALFYSSPWCKLFKHDFLKKNHIVFNEVRCGNDVVFMAKAALHANRCYAIDKVAYCVTFSTNTITAEKTIATNEIRLQQDIIGLRLYKKRYKLSRLDKYWYFHTWYNLYKMTPKKAYCYFGKMFYLLGSSFLYNFVKVLLKDIKLK